MSDEQERAAIERLREIANRDEARTLSVSADDLRAILALRAPELPAQGEGALAYAERVRYEEQILSLEMELERVRKVLTPLATRACGWEQNHSYQGTDSTQISHRLGDFRAARSQLQRLDRIAEGKVERPFAYCCAEGGGHVDACDCVNKNHGTAWFEAPALQPVAERHSELQGERDHMLETVRKFGPNGEYVVVRAWPNGDYDIYDPKSPNAPRVVEPKGDVVLVSREALERLATAPIIDGVNYRAEFRNMRDELFAMLAAAHPAEPCAEEGGHSCPSCDPTPQFAHGVPINRDAKTRVITPVAGESPSHV
jgi:hypothetical protein